MAPGERLLRALTHGQTSVAVTKFGNVFLSHSCAISLSPAKRARVPERKVPVGSPSRGGDVTVYVFDVNQPSLPTPFHSVLVSISVFMALSTVFHSINSPDNSLLSHSVLLISALVVLSAIYLSMKVSFSPDITFCG